MNQHPSHRVGLVSFAAVSPVQAQDVLIETALSGATAASAFHLANAYTVALADKDPEYQSVLSERALNFPDGKPIMWASRLRRDEVPLQQVRGPALFEAVLDAGRHADLRHYLLGSTAETLEKLKNEISARYPGLRIVGCFSPPFRKMTVEEIAEQDDAILRAKPHVIWVGLGTPKQDVEALRLVKSLGVSAVAIGAAFDFSAGNLKEAPGWISRLGLEWLHRLLLEPKRLWRRYLFGNLRFVRTTLRNWNAA